MYLIFYAVLRFIIEFFRGDVARGFIMSGLSVSQGISLLLLIAGIAGLVALRKRRPIS
jgi:phosphatidylglycerol:prolipoprotein diacylglycerol transferase